jgi:hypothetical protein
MLRKFIKNWSGVMYIEYWVVCLVSNGFNFYCSAFVWLIQVKAENSSIKTVNNIAPIPLANLQYFKKCKLKKKQFQVARIFPWRRHAEINTDRVQARSINHGVCMDKFLKFISST